ncbi:winged helix-turn-helix domain-containing protein [Streptomyces sp. NBC_00063]|uniref:helix-turn-helix transcriptional regulator n=1 Tax=Streptomyces sp. NBC_00063 TaxID=2975638 RepID=UPI0022528B3C|nr:winged helix-turn-helix domain-containing protein [Streptomyces sp. NBC_00063]MCX5443833.1 winged helix-turn-helix domain-containing protein [Streptomyces sp. NBC_00063]
MHRIKGAVHDRNSIAGSSGAEPGTQSAVVGRCGCRVGTGTAIGQCLPGFHNPEIFETLPNARLSPTARDVFDILTARQEASGLVRIRQKDLAKRPDISQAAVSRAIGQLKDKGILDGRHRQGTILIRPLLAAYESLAHMINHLQDPTTFVWPLNYPPARSDRRAPAAADCTSLAMSCPTRWPICRPGRPPTEH